MVMIIVNSMSVGFVNSKFHTLFNEKRKKNSIPRSIEALISKKEEYTKIRTKAIKYCFLLVIFVLLKIFKIILAIK